MTAQNRVPRSATAKPEAPRQVAVTASSSFYTDQEWRALQKAKQEHQGTTSAARRALKVVNQTTQVAATTLESLYEQGQQVERAAHGIEQIDENVQHAGRIIAFMSRCFCFRTAKYDPDLEEERCINTRLERQRMAGVAAAEDIAAGYAAKQGMVGSALAKRAAAAGPDADAAAEQAAVDAAAAGKEPWSGVIAAVPGPLGKERARGRSSMPLLGQGLEERDRQELQHEVAKQDYYLGQISSAVDALHAMGLAMGQELAEQAPKLDALHRRADEAGEELHAVTSGAAKLAGRAPRRLSSASDWRGEQDVANHVVQRAVVASAPLAARYALR